MKNTGVITTINVSDFDKSPVDLIKRYPDKTLLLLFYNNACLGCTGRAIPLAYKFQQTYPEIQVIGIHSNFSTNNVTEKDIMSIFSVKELPFPIYLDNNHKVYDSFQAEGTPQWVLLTSKGEIYRSIFGSQENAQNRLYYAIENLLEDIL
ncbi:peroxiredoxin [Mesonia hippocampi]|uniref:Peroxiredoxin n=1 Tax=Mesonia hippocampi TaxID=1628250 RepID=A0A840EJE8_9FLAO|nr:redoxin domain-containing protein [Mesonia hippocampi]MBB4118499.1 peroxiredoxin [Mesonia hippocampi]